MPTTSSSELPSGATLQKLRADLAIILGEENIRTLEPDWIAKMRAGVVVQIHVGRTRGEVEFHEEEIGISTSAKDKTERRREWYALGYKRVLPARYLKRLASIDSSARKWLTQCGSRTYWGTFLPAEGYSAWKERNAQYENDYMGVGQEILDNYEAVVAEVCLEHGKLARDAYVRLCRLDPAFRAQHRDVEAYVAAQVLQTRALIPTKQQIEDMLRFEVELFYIPLPSLLAEDLATAQRIKEESQAATALRREVYERMLAQKEALITSFMRDTILKIQQMLYEVSVDVLSTVRANGKVGGKSANQLRSLLTGLEQYLNFAPNDDIEQMMEQIRSFLDLQPGNARRTALPKLERQLAATATLARDVLLRLGDNPRSARELGIPDMPTPALVQQVRRTLQSSATVPAPLPLQRRTARPGALTDENPSSMPITASA